MSEAIEWIALGRVPQMQPDVDIHTDEVSDYRFSWQHMPDNFEPKFEYAWFDQREFESLGIQVTEEYFFAAEICHSECISDLPNQIAEYEARNQAMIKFEDGTQIDIFTQMAADARAKLEKFGPQKNIVDEAEAQFKPYLEVACAKLFQLLIKQEITCQAVDYDRWNRLADKDEYEKAAQFDNVPIRAFTCLLYTSPSPRDQRGSRMPSSA